MNSIIKKTGYSFGIILAVYYLLANNIVFFSDYNFFIKPTFGFVNIVVILLLGISCVWITKRRLGGLITFKEGFTPYLIMIFFGFLVNIATQYVLFNFVNEEAKITTNQIMTDLAIQSVENADIPLEDKQKQLEYLNTHQNDSFSLQTMFFSFMQNLLGGTIAGLLIALIFKNRSEFNK